MYAADFDLRPRRWNGLPKDQYFQSGKAILVATRSKNADNLLLKQCLDSCGLRVAECTNDLANLPPLGASGVAILVLDYAYLRDGTDTELLHRLTNSSQNLRVLVVGKNVAEEEKRDLLSTGVRGFLVLPHDIPFLTRALSEIAAGGLWFERSILTEAILRDLHEEFRRHKNLAKIANGETHGDLTPREEIVARCASEGLRNREIADKLHISEKTVKLHLTRVYKKLGVSSRVQLSVLMYRG